MELKQLRYFKTAAEFQHITKAANALDINQPVLSRSLSALEEELGVELFDHVGRGITLNENGIYFYKRVCEIFATLEDACEDLKTQNYDAASMPDPDRVQHRALYSRTLKISAREDAIFPDHLHHSGSDRASAASSEQGGRLHHLFPYAGAQISDQDTASAKRTLSHHLSGRPLAVYRKGGVASGSCLRAFHCCGKRVRYPGCLRQLL